MKIFKIFSKSNVDQRSLSVENPANSLAAVINSEDYASSGEFSPHDAMRIPAVAGAIGFIASTVASLPMRLYKVNSDGTKELVRNTKQSRLFNLAPSPTITSYNWRNHMFSQGVLLRGRGYSVIKRNGSGQITEIVPVDQGACAPYRLNGEVKYSVTVNDRRYVYDAHEMIDIPWSLQGDFIRHYKPLWEHKEALHLGYALNHHLLTHFEGGAVPPFVMTGKFSSGAAIENAANDILSALKKIIRMKSRVLPVPLGHEIKEFPVSNQASQALEMNRFFILQVARIWQLPPIFVQDFSNGSFSNVENQDLHLTKHTIRRWVEQFEQELSSKCFPKGNYVVEMDMGALQRGDYESRVKGHSLAIHSGQMTINEAREVESRPPVLDGDEIRIQAATAPLGDPENGEHKEEDGEGKSEETKTPPGEKKDDKKGVNDQ